MKKKATLPTTVIYVLVHVHKFMFHGIGEI